MQPPTTGPNALTLVTPLILPLGATAISVDVSSLPYAVLADPCYSQLEISLYGSTTVNQSPITVNPTQVKFMGLIAIDATKGNSVITFIARGYDPTKLALAGATTWMSSTYYTAGSTSPLIIPADWFVDGNGYVQLCTSSGTSGLVEPTIFTTMSPPLDVPGTVTPEGTGLEWTNMGLYEVSPVTKFTIIPVVSGMTAVIGPPSGISSYKSQVTCRVEWLMPNFEGTIGTKVMLSTDPAGVNPAYVQYGDVVPTSAVNRVATQVIYSSSNTSYNPTTGVQIITTTNQTAQFTYNYVDIPPTAVNGATQFYAMLSTVVQDPTTYVVFESQQSGPVTCGFVNLNLASPTDFLALQRKEDIAGRLITQMTQIYPDLDLTPRSEIRDLLVDPVSIELSNVSVREWFSRCGASVSAMSQIDNASGNGISDDFNSSPVKQQISRAFGLDANDTQTLINQQFDILGESVGLLRGGATSSVVTVTFYTYVRPTSTVSFPTGIICTTIPNSVTPSLSFITTGSAVVTPNSAASFYDPVNGWWGVNIPASCQTTGSSTNVGAGTIASIGSGAPAGWNVTNLVAATFGLDDEINSHYASRIAVRQITGVDSGTRDGYMTTALATPGVVAAEVVAAGDLEMLRDWDDIRQKHVYGCVDVYCQGTSSSEEDQVVAFDYQTAGTPGVYSSSFSGLPLSLASTTGAAIVFQVGSAALSQLDWTLCQGVELQVNSLTGTFYLGVSKTRFDSTGGYVLVDPSELAYQVVSSGTEQTTTTLQVNGANATNLVAVTYAGSSATYTLCARLRSPLSYVPAEQPVANVNSVVGKTDYTGAIPDSLIDLVHHSDFLLYGGSNRAGDEMQVVSTVTVAATKTIVASVPAGVPAPTFIDYGMAVRVDANGNVGNILSVRSTDLSTLYVYSLLGRGGDYTIATYGPYDSYSLLPLVKTVNMTQVSVSDNILTVACANDFGVGAPIVLGLPSVLNPTYTGPDLDGQTVYVAASTGTAFTAAYTYGNFSATDVAGTATGSALVDGTPYVVAYDKYVLVENLSFSSGESQTLNGSVANTLDNQGFVHNVWLPPTYGTSYLNPAGDYVDGTSLVADADLAAASIPYGDRYIKVMFDGEVMVENVDFILTVDPTSGTAAIQRNTATNGTSRIKDGGQVLVSYFHNEAFTVATEYPSFVPILANEIATRKHAAADVVVKAMVANPVDVTMTVVLKPGVTADVLDPQIRTAIDQVLDNAETTLYQSELVSHVQAIAGVQSVALPLVKCAKSDGSYDIGVVIPTGTAWVPLAQDAAFSGLPVPGNSFITKLQVLPDSTVPSGGPTEAFVGLLYQGQEYARTMSVQDFINNAATPAVSSEKGSFYIIGSGDTLPSGTALPPTYAQKVIITIPADTASPSLKSYFVTYQVWGETSASDITLSSTEYITPGRVTVNYLTSGA